jgi:hypothetical protein
MEIEQSPKAVKTKQQDNFLEILLIKWDFNKNAWRLKSSISYFSKITWVMS